MNNAHKHDRGRSSWLALCIVLILGHLVLSSRAISQDVCPPVNLEDLRAKRDYYTALQGLDKSASGDWQRLKTVEKNHFNSDVRNLVRGQTVTHPGGDIMFILGHFPNHIPALEALVRLAFRDRTTKPAGIKNPVQCTLERAVAFRPDDPMTRTLYGVYLARMKQNDKAIEQLEMAEESRPNDANVLYNLGLLYFEKKDYERSLAYAKRAYAAGFPLPGLKEKLIAAGRWKAD